ncbi:CCA tRNA nucleotidyltransferase [Siccirubricoccus sp. G192]|uniref:CCA tRNA nucleotidyltransferase n=1 Tax=Siccirubricoccus sp. G192 TaxID=2849651 RepID=UPI001C2C1B2E|nr:CCA tRNA nucleotidyltransferase [Siccirubricoccus sp. G192]MBV1797333.1 CCA tRNA nucleotidyltransferase [Siccirubricoccus sp. G192]
MTAPDPPSTVIPPPDSLAREAPAAVLAALPEARAVGGCVRDALAGLPVHDVDIAAPLPPEAIVARLRQAGLKVFATGLSHGTVTAVLAHQPVEVTSLRRDVATDGRHAEVEWTTDWREDAARRDFTINAMSLGADGRLWDYFGGCEDLAVGRVRFVGDPATRLREDYLRALRFFRFQARYGSGAPDPAAMAAIRAAVPGLARLSAERVWMEIKRLLEAPDPAGAVALMAEAGVLGAVLPEATELPALARLVALEAPREPLLRLAALLPAGLETAPLAARLRFSGEEAGRLAAWRGPSPDPAAAGDDLRRLLAERAGALLAKLAWLAEARGVAGDWAGFRARVADRPRLDLPVQGRDVLALGVPPGPAVGRRLAALRAWWKAGGCNADRASCLERLRELAAAGRV